MHTIKFKTSMALLAVGTMTSSITFAAETKTKPVKDDTIEIISTEVATAEEPAVNDIKDKKPDAEPVKEATVKKPTVKQKESTVEQQPVKQPAVKESTIEAPPVKAVKPVKESVQNTTEQPVQQTQTPSVENSEQEQPTTEMPTTEIPASDETATTEEHTTTEQPAVLPHNNEPSEGKEADKIDEGKFSPHKGEKYYASLDKQVNHLVTKKLDQAEADKVSSGHKHSKALPDSGEHNEIYFGLALLLLGLILSRRTNLQK